MSNHKSVKKFLVNWAAVLVLIVSFVTFLLVGGNRFLSGSNMVNILRAMAITTVFGIAATITMSTEEIDLTIGTLGSFSAYIFVSSYLWFGQSLVMSILICIVGTLIIHQLTMFLVLVCKIPYILATVALMFVHQGLGQWYIGGGAVSTGMNTPWGAAPLRTQLSYSFSAIGRAPWIIIIMLGCVLVVYLFLSFTKHGRYLYAIGSNKEAAKLSGIDIKKNRYLAGILTAVFIAIGGIIVASRSSSAQVMSCDNYLMPALAAVFIGRSVGGAEKPHALGTMIGAMLVSTLENGLTIMAVPFYVLPAVKGAVMALALISAYASKKED
jgi:simple sugar transport system permease protein